MPARFADDRAAFTADFGVELGSVCPKNRFATLLSNLVIVFLTVFLGDLPASKSPGFKSADLRASSSVF